MCGRQSASRVLHGTVASLLPSAGRLLGRSTGPWPHPLSTRLSGNGLLRRRIRIRVTACVCTRSRGTFYAPYQVRRGLEAIKRLHRRKVNGEALMQQEGRMTHNGWYSIGDTIPGGKKVGRIVGQSEAVIVYITETETVAYHVDDKKFPATRPTADIVRLSLHHFTKAYADAKKLFPPEEWTSIRDELASSLYNSLTCDDHRVCADSFVAVSERITGKVANTYRLCYLMAASLAALISAIVCLGFWQYLRGNPGEDYALCAVFSVLGAFASVILRTSSVPVVVGEDWRITALRGAFRIILAMLLTAFLIAAAKANLLAGIFTLATWSLLAYSFVCGFSERFGPEILANLERGKSRAAGR